VLVSTVRACAAPLGNLETTVTLVRVARPYIASFPGPRRGGEKGLGTRLDHTLLNHGSRYIHVQPSSFSKAVSCALGKVGKPRMAPKDEQLMAIQHVYTARTCLYMYGFLPFVFVPRLHFGKSEAAYRHRGLASYVSTRCSCCNYNRNYHTESVFFSGPLGGGGGGGGSWPSH